ncbi:MAG: 50S ribosomal protein L9 [Planctomycetota bacterium]
MEILLREDVEKLGQMGDIVEVADGYARNYLLPKQKAVPVTEENKAQIRARRQAREEKQKAEYKRLEDKADKLSDFVCYIPVKATEEGRLFGSVTAEDIADSLEESGFQGIRPSFVGLTEPIEETGDFDVEIMLHPDIRVEITVHVAPESEIPEEEL